MAKIIGILGYGEIGKSLAKFYQNKKKYKLLIKSLTINQFEKEKIDILNIAIPYSEKFIKIVSGIILEHKPKLTIIHSTILPGTTEKLISCLPRAYQGIVHSPIRGIHPNLFKGIKTFVKYIGAENLKTGQLVAKHFKEIGIKNVKILKPAAATEVNKLIDTTYYAHCIVFTDYVNEICKKYKILFSSFTDFNLSYNEGYKKLKKSNVIRPTLYPPPNKKIGGHCQVPNAKILEKIFPHQVTKNILKYK